MEGIQGKVVIVTGGGRGLGEQISRILAEAGSTVIVGDIRTELAQKVVDDICGQGQQAEAVRLDVTDEGSVKTALAQVIEKYCRLDVIVNNAGTDVTLPVDELETKDWDLVMSVNFRGPFLMARHGFPYFKQQGRGQMVNIVSTAAKRAWPNASVYHASKWGLLGLSYALHAEGRKDNIKVTAVIAGGMKTAFLLDRFPDIDVNNLQDPKNVAATVRFVLTQPEETVISEIMVIPMRETSWPMSLQGAPAVFLDKDGTLIEDVPYSVDPARIRLTPGAGEALHRLREARYKLVVVSNQSGVARGFFPEAALQGVVDCLAALLGAYGVLLDGFYYCPHHPDGAVPEYVVACACRKPAPGLLLQAASELGISLERSWLIGDILNDVEAGHRAGCRSILLDNGNETEWELIPARLPDFVASDLMAAADRILNGEAAANTPNYSELGESRSSQTSKNSPEFAQFAAASKI